MLRAIILIVAFVGAQADECVRKLVGPDAIVCVCNSTYCDTIDEPMMQENQFLWYTSTMNGQRMQVTVNQFSPIMPINDAENELIISVDSLQKYQKIHGFGGAVTDAVALNIRTLSVETQQKLFNSYYSPEGIGYSHCRIPIAGTDFSTRPYTYDDTPGDVTLSNFSLVEEDTYKIEALNNIKSSMSEPQNLRIFTTSWSAPAWMKMSKRINWGTLKRKYYQVYANYFKKFFEAYKEQGVDIWGLTPGNEPVSGLFPTYPFNAMYWSPRTEAYWTANFLEPTLAKAGFNPVYMAMDDQRFELPWYPNIVFANNKANELFSGVAYHWYFDQVFSVLRLTQMHNSHPEKFILMTEACSGSYPWEIKVILGSWARGERYLADIIDNLSHWVTGWIDWNIALNKTGGPNWAKNFVDSPIIVIPETDEFYKQPMFYAISHVSKFVPRDSFRIDSTGIDNRNLRSVAFLTPDQKIVIVLLNKSELPIAVALKNKNHPDKTINLEIPAKSFNTVIYLEM